MRRIDRSRQRPAPMPQMSTEERFAWQEFVNLFGKQYALGGSPGNTPDANFVSYVRQVGERNGVVAAAVAARSKLMSQVRFVWKNTRASNTHGRMFGDQRLAVLENPGQLTRNAWLSLAETDVCYSGSHYSVRRGNKLNRLRPDGVAVLFGSDKDPVNDWLPSDAEIIGYGYANPDKPGSRAEGFMPDEVIAWSPDPHPIEWWRGTSWITSVVSEIRNDGQATEHTSKFFENAATPRLVFTMDPSKTPEQIREYAAVVNDGHNGVRNAYKNLYIGGADDVTVVGSDLGALSLRDITGGYEARIASASRVPAVVLGIREGMQGSALNSGNYGQTRRLWADGWFTPECDSLCAAVARVIPGHNDDAELSHDPSQVLFLQEDRKDEAEVQNSQAVAMRQLVDAGYTPDSVRDAITSNDFGRLVHSGLYSVQLHPPGEGSPPPAA